MSRVWGKASACRLQITLSCAVLCHIVSLQYLSRSSSHRLAGLPCHMTSFQVVTCEVHRSSVSRLICPAQDHFIFLSVEFCPLPDPDVGPSIFVCDVEHTSFHFGLCGRKFVLCLFGHSVQVSAPYVIAGSTQELYTCLFRQMARLLKLKITRCLAYTCCPACHDSSLYLFVLVLILEAVVLSQVHVALDIFYQHIVHVYSPGCCLQPSPLSLRCSP